MPLSIDISIIPHSNHCIRPVTDYRLTALKNGQLPVQAEIKSRDTTAVKLTHNMLTTLVLRSLCNEQVILVDWVSMKQKIIQRHLTNYELEEVSTIIDVYSDEFLVVSLVQSWININIEN